MITFFDNLDNGQNRANALYNAQPAMIASARAKTPPRRAPGQHARLWIARPRVERIALLGDSPHETPGWYFVYDTGEATLAIISAHADERRMGNRRFRSDGIAGPADDWLRVGIACMPDTVVIVVFCFVYIGMILGRFPRLALDRTGVALLGAIALLATGRVTVADAWNAVDVPTICLLFGLMVVSAQFRLGGAYTAITHRIVDANMAPTRLLAVLIGVVGIMSALLANDIVCLAIAPLLVEACARRELNPKPFLLALACAANIGSAATLIGNPQNMLIGQVLQLSFGRYLIDGGIPAVLGLVTLWWILKRLFHGQWHTSTTVPEVEAVTYNAWQSTKAVTILMLLVAGFLLAPLPREILALVAAGIILTSRRMHTRHMLGLVDWQLLVLFVSLFVVNRALQSTGSTERLVMGVASGGWDITSPSGLFVTSAVLSNVVSNVPAVMLLLPAATHSLAGPVLALSSTLAGNLFIVGSIANIIVVDQAGRLGVRIVWREHARVGIPVTVATLAIAAAWIYLMSFMAR